MFIGGLLMQMYPDALPTENLGNYFGAVFVIMSVFVLDNIKIKELQDKVENLEKISKATRYLKSLTQAMKWEARNESFVLFLCADLEVSESVLF